MTRSFIAAAMAALLATASSATDAAADCQITFRVGSTANLFSLVVTASYRDAPGEFKGLSTAVECETLNDTIVSVGDADQARGLLFSAVTAPGFELDGPKNILRCTWLPSGRNPVIGDFDLSEQSAFTTGFQPVDPEVTVSDIDCDGGPGTTTTTLPDEEVCGDYDGNGLLQVADALGVLRAAVGTVPCALCVCDVDGNGFKTTADALNTLRRAVGLSLPSNCSPC
jgi:hypothetical protein